MMMTAVMAAKKEKAKDKDKKGKKEKKTGWVEKRKENGKWLNYREVGAEFCSFISFFSMAWSRKYLESADIVISYFELRQMAF
jgi:hypothetical protein